MYHGGEIKLEVVPTEVQRMHIFNQDHIPCNAIVPLEHLYRMFVSHNLNIGVAVDQQPDRSGVVRFHMIDDQVINRFVTQHCCHFLKKKIGIADIHRIDQCPFLVVDDISVIGDPMRQRPEIFEEMFRAVVHPHVIHIFGNFKWFIHIE